MNSSRDVMFEDFYSVIARYLMEIGLVDKIDINEKRLIVHEKPSGMFFEFTLSITRWEVKKNG